MIEPCIVVRAMYMQIYGEQEDLCVGILTVSLCEWLDRARFRWSCLFESCKHGQTHLSSHFLTETDEGIPFWGDRCMYSRRSEVKELQQLVHDLWAIYRVFEGSFFSANLFVLVCSRAAL